MTRLAFAEAPSVGQRRREIEAVLNPRRMVTYAHVGRAIDLAVHYEWNVAPAAHHEQRAVWRTRTIFTPPVDGDQQLAAFAHEGGHLEHQDDQVDFEDTFVAELAAWLFSIKMLGFRWNQAMNDYMADCLWTYRPGYVRTNENRRAMEALIAHGRTKQAISLRPAPIPQELSVIINRCAK